MRGLAVLVTGPSGFVGHHLARALRSAGANVRGIGLDRPDDLIAEGALQSWGPCDMADREAVRGAIAEARPKVVIHLAGQSSAGISFEHPDETYRVNALGTVFLLEAIRREAPGARVLIVGTSEAYGPQIEGTRVGEGAPLRPVSPYGLSKAAADMTAEFHARVHGMDVVRTRSFNHVGPGQAAHFAIPGFARQIAAIEAGHADPVLKVGNLEVTRDLTDVRDVVEAYRLLIERGRRGAAYNVCRGEGMRLSEIVDRLCARGRVSIRVEVDPARMRPADVPYLVGDPSAIHRDTGWRASRSLDAVLEEVLEEWRRRVPAEA